MSGQRTPDACPVKWCDETPADHFGRHRQYVGEVQFDGRQPVTSIHVGLEAPQDAARPVLVVTVAAARPSRYQAAELSWEQADELAAMLTGAGKRWRA
ncbi:hypothetical protein [Jiangella mangrovi]|uniref:Uncharacterized protein n=1 Tax=Jiangella mangrovi TaxID=1524084 RepID=A0A7W9LJF6_9ACTN|nr:hypothetical protein [Jiangella mangrovi]MBB5785998.1 hypothetical protein [Jiangella mangrovi]